MENSFKSGDVKLHQFQVNGNDVAKFDTGVVHEVCSTFKLGKEMEWASRLFILDMIEAHEEGVGTSLGIRHHAPAFIGEIVNIEAVFNVFHKNELTCDIRVKVGERNVASGITRQKIMSKKKIEQVFSRLN